MPIKRLSIKKTVAAITFSVSTDLKSLGCGFSSCMRLLLKLNSIKPKGIMMIELAKAKKPKSSGETK